MAMDVGSRPPWIPGSKVTPGPGPHHGYRTHGRIPLRVFEDGLAVQRQEVARPAESSVLVATGMSEDTSSGV